MTSPHSPRLHTTNATPNGTSNLLLFGSRGMSPDHLWDTMDIQALKLELVQQLVSTDDATVLTKVKRLLELLRARKPGRQVRCAIRRS